MIRLEDIELAYNDKKIIDNFQLDVKENDFLVILGESGSGKTTITRLINDVIKYSEQCSYSGNIFLKGNNVKDCLPYFIPKCVGSVFQDPRTQFFTNNVYDELAFCMENYAFSSEKIISRVNEVATINGLLDLLNSDTKKLSGGQKQMIAISSIQCYDPEIYLFDEPSANLDKDATNKLKSLLTDLKNCNKTIIISEHRISYLSDLATKYIYIKDGKIKHTWNKKEFDLLNNAQLQELGLRDRVLTFDKSIINEFNPECDNTYLKLSDLSIYTNDKRLLLNKLNLSFSIGEVVGIVGKNGVGKTTLVNVLTGISKRYQGEVIVDDLKTKCKQRNGLIWLVMQDSEYQLLSDSVLNELLIGFEHNDENISKALKILASLSLLEYKDEHPNSLSGGQKQRVTFAISLMQNAKVIVLDEPTSGLDKRNLIRVSNLIKKYAKDRIFIIITHDFELVNHACTRIVCLANKCVEKDINLSVEEDSVINKYLM